MGVVQTSLAAGVPVLGYFHWSTIDNMEWTAGYCPKFGLYRVDLDDPARPRIARSSALVYKQIIADRQVTDALLGSLPPYTSQTSFCASRP